MLNLALIVGLWATTCIQTQNTNYAGFAIESYDVRENGNYEFKREWFSDASCSSQYGVEKEEGNLEIGKKLSGMFVQGETYEANFTTTVGTDLGAVKIDGKKIKVARGMRNSTMRNTMVGIFEYAKK